MATSSIKQAVYLNAAARYSTLVLRLLFNAALARILVPEDFGVVAVAMVFTTFFSLLSDMGLGAGIIQNKELSREDIGSIFAFSLRLGLVLMGAFALFSLPMAHFYGNRALVPVGMLLSVQLFFNTLNVVPNALLLKQKEFGKVALRILCACLTSGAVGIGLALLGLKYYALVAQAILDAVFIFSCRVHLQLELFLHAAAHGPQARVGQPGKNPQLLRLPVWLQPHQLLCPEPGQPPHRQVYGTCATGLLRQIL